MTTSTQLQLRRGTTAQLGAMTPAPGEVLVDTSRNTLVVGDGTTAGGATILARTVGETLTDATLAGRVTMPDGSILATSGAASLTIVLTGATSVTLPTSGTLITSTEAPVQSVAGRTGAVALAAADISGLASSATTDATNASNIASGTLAVAHGGTGATAITGSGSNVLATSPTFTGTVTGPDAGAWSSAGIGTASLSVSNNITVACADVTTTAVRIVNPGGSFSRGVDCQISGTSSSNYAVIGAASGSGGAGSVNYAIYGAASGSTTNWAGYFSSGNVYVQNRLGLNSMSPTAMLTLDGAGGSGIVRSYYNQSASAGIYADIFHAGDASGLSIQSRGSTTGSGNITFWTGATTPSLAVTIGYGGAVRFSAYGAGSITSDASGNLTSVSDERVKDRIRPYAEGLSAILKIRPIAHHYAADSGLETTREYAGFSAQNVRAAGLTHAVHDKDGRLHFNAFVVVAALVNAVQEQQRQITALTARLDGMVPT